ncbi:MAG: asparagine synthase (glutamine-hydrolyzing) [Defluviitaleaceae bacterium]|nr:asparagine synthase (glutamine-hydrolyzing) [Defluviitaleaceae bacterium]
MCGIVGWVEGQACLEAARPAIEKMTQTLEKRGPDQGSTWMNGQAVFGHRRLAVIDLEGGRQPMEKSGCTLVYNGELYNTDSLRKELKALGYAFSDESDTEVLLTAYLVWKEHCVDHLNGIFAFAIWDDRDKTLFVARDRLGVKPLFFKEGGHKLYFASELKAILAHPEVKAKVSYHGLAEVLGLGPSRSPGHGVFEGIQALKPGHYLTFSTKSGLKIKRYWDVESRPHTDDFLATVEKTRFLLTAAIERQLVSDVPLCTFLSGGVDSSAITAIAAKSLKDQPLHTYSIDYEGSEQYFAKNAFQPDSDERFIKLMSETFKTHHHRQVIDNEALFFYLEEATYARDLPGMADVDSSLLWFSKEIKKDFTVGLSGECADEIFGGYPWFYRDDDLSGEHFPWLRSTGLRTSLLRETWQQKLQIGEYIKAQYLKTIRETPELAGESPVEKRRREMFYLNKEWFMATLLERKDRMSMAAGLEVRVPFADHHLVEYLWNVPWEMKFYNGREKGLLREALRGILPEDVLFRKKSPYPKTFHPAYTQAVVAKLKEVLQQKSSILHELFDPEQLKTLIESEGKVMTVPWFGQLMMYPQLVAYLLQIHWWVEKYGVDISE